MGKIENVHELEQMAIFLLNSEGWELEWTGEGFEHYDAKGKSPDHRDCVVEFKFRKERYFDKMLEDYKFKKLMEVGCAAFYAVCDPSGIFIFDLFEMKKLEDSGAMYKRKIKCPETSFWKNDKIVKETYFLDPTKAKHLHFFLI